MSRVTQERKELLLRELNAITNTVQAICDGKTVLTACTENGVPLSKFYKFAQTKFTEKGKFAEGQPVNYNVPELLRWEDRFLIAILGKNAVMLSDFYEAFDYVLDNTLTEREAKVIRLRFKEELDLDDTGKYFGVTRERIRQIEAKAIKKIKHPTRHIYFLEGMNGPTLKKLRQNVYILEREKAKELERLKSYEEALKKEVEVLKEKTTKLKSEVDLANDRISTAYDDIPIEELELSVRPYNSLKRHDVNTIGDIKKVGVEGMRDFRNMGRHSLMEIIEQLRTKFNIVLESEDLL